MKTFILLCYFATWAAIPHLLLLKKRPAATLAWLWAIIFIPFLGTLVYGLFGTDRLKRRRLKRRRRFTAHPSRERAPSSATDAATAALVQDLPRRDRQFLQLLSRINQLPVTSADELHILRDAEDRPVGPKGRPDLAPAIRRTSGIVARIQGADEKQPQILRLRWEQRTLPTLLRMTSSSILPLA